MAHRGVEVPRGVVAAAPPRSVSSAALCSWYMLRYFRMGAPTDAVRLGLLVQSPTGTGCRATFTDIVVGDAPEDMRAG